MCLLDYGVFILIIMITFTYKIFVILLCRMSVGDGGIDIFGIYENRILLIQCKNYNAKVKVGEINKFEGVLSRFPKEIIFGIFVTANVDGYSSYAMSRANSSNYDLLLTNLSSLKQDIRNYAFKNRTGQLPLILHHLEELMVSRIETRIKERERKMDEWMNKMIAENKKRDLITYTFFIIIIFILIIILIK